MDNQIKQLTNEELKPYYNEYMRRYRKNNKDKWNAIRRDNYKKYSNNITKKKINNSNNITKKKINNSNNITKINPIDLI
jgi:hypothetical protein